MNKITLPTPKLEIFKNIEILKKNKEEKQKKEKNKKKYLDHLFKDNDIFLKKYFE
tara:strand:- start:5116 stop:5280 length:165 start_codon:yes stop_codon:yes gene_type:complete